MEKCGATPDGLLRAAFWYIPLAQNLSVLKSKHCTDGIVVNRQRVSRINGCLV